MEDWPYTVSGTGTPIKYGKVPAIASIDHYFRIIRLKRLKRNLVTSDKDLDNKGYTGVFLSKISFKRRHHKLNTNRFAAQIGFVVGVVDVLSVLLTFRPHP